jgi:hypothetical protein
MERSGLSTVWRELSQVCGWKEGSFISLITFVEHDNGPRNLVLSETGLVDRHLSDELLRKGISVVSSADPLQ